MQCKVETSMSPKVTLAATRKHRQASCYTYAKEKGGEKRRKKWKAHKGTEEAKG